MARFTLGFAIAALLCLSSAAPARTWHVQKDGSGDFTVIQDALDAAASGDTIRIGPGRFEDFRIYRTNGGDQAVIAMVQVAEMMFIGSGSDQTVIGPASYTWQDGEPPPRGILWIAQPITGRVHVEAMTLENLISGVYVENAGPLTVADCAFNGGYTGINAYASTTADRCSFADCKWGMIVRSPAETATATDCTFSSSVSGHTGLQFQGSRTGIARRCAFTGCVDCNSSGVVFAGSGGGVYDCTFQGILRPIYLSSSNYPEILRNRVVTAGTCLYSGSEAFTLEGNAFWSTGPYPTIEMYSRGLPHTIRGNDIQRGRGLAVRIIGHTGPADYHLDMTGNWWGTTDADSIASWIRDGTGVIWPPGGLPECTVDFVPFARRPVPAEKKSMGDVKAMFWGD